MQLHQAIAETLKRHKVTAVSVAREAGLSESQVSFFLRGERGMEYKNLCLFLDALPQSVYQEVFLLMAGGDRALGVRQAISALQQSNLSDNDVADLLSVCSRHVRQAGIPANMSANVAAVA